MLIFLVIIIFDCKNGASILLVEFVDHFFTYLLKNNQ